MSSSAWYATKAPSHLDRPLPANHPAELNLGTWLDRNRDTLHARPGARRIRSGRRALVWSLAFSPDGRRLAIGQQGLDGQPSVLRVWDLAEKKDVMWRARPSAYRCVAFSPDGKRLVTGTFDATVEMYQMNGDVATLDGFWKELGNRSTP